MANNGIRRIFYDNSTGESIMEIGRGAGMTIPTIEQDILTYTALSTRNPGTYDVMELDMDDMKADFSESTGYKIELSTGKLLFSYSDPNAPAVEQPYQEPLSKQIETLRTELTLSKEAIDFLLMGGM